MADGIMLHSPLLPVWSFADYKIQGEESESDMAASFQSPLLSSELNTFRLTEWFLVKAGLRAMVMGKLSCQKGFLCSPQFLLISLSSASSRFPWQPIPHTAATLTWQYLFWGLLNLWQLPTV